MLTRVSLSILLLSGFCGCSSCPNGSPEQYKVTISGVTNDSCSECDDFNGDFYLGRDEFSVSCDYSYDFGSGFCGKDTIQLLITFGSGGLTISVVMLDIEWQAAGLSSCLDDEYVLEKVGDDDDNCNWPSTIRVSPVGFTRNSASASLWKCMGVMQPGPDPPGTIKNPYAVPFIGESAPHVMAFVAGPLVQPRVAALDNVQGRVERLRNLVAWWGGSNAARAGFSAGASEPALVNSSSGKSKFGQFPTGFSLSVTSKLSPSSACRWSSSKRRRG